MFSAVLGLASGVAGIIGANNSYALAMEELNLKRKALADQKDMAMMNYGMGLDQMRREREQEAYIKAANEQNQRFAQQEYATKIGQFEQRKQQAGVERQYVLDRQVAMDKEAAKRQQFMLEQFLQNQNLAKEEREYAIQQLNEAKAIAAGERDEDLRKRAEEQQQAAEERQFAIEQMQRSQQIALQERNDDFLFRDDIIGRLDAMQAQMSGALSSMPALDAPELLGRDDFESILARFDANAIANVDRATDRVASQGEADLMTRGLQNSSIGQSARSDIARRMSLEYENARQQALQQALQYISGQNDITLQDYNARKDARGTTLQEIQAMTMPAIEGMMNMRQLSSANDYQLPIQVGSGIVQRNVRSANDYQSPVAVSSAIFNNSDIGYGLADMLAAPSTADAFVYDAGTQQFQPQAWGITSPSGFFGNAQSGINSIPGQYDPSSWASRGDTFLQNGLSDIGQAVGDFEHGGFFKSSPQSPVNFKANTSFSSFLGYSPTSNLPMTAPLPTARASQMYPYMSGF